MWTATPTRETRPKSLDAWAASLALMLFYGGIHFGCASRISDPEAILPVGMWQRERHAPQALRRYRFCLGGACACEQPAPPTPQIRPVRAVTVEHRVISEPLVLIGQIKPRNEISLAFRIDGKLIERVGHRRRQDHRRSTRGTTRLRKTSRMPLQGAEADIAAAQAALAQAEKLEARQADLLKRAITSRALHEQALAATSNRAGAAGRRAVATANEPEPSSSIPSWKPKLAASSPPREPSRANLSAPAK